MKKILIVEPMAGGHRDHFLKALVQELERKESKDTEYIFLVSEDSRVEYRNRVIVERLSSSQVEGFRGWRLKYVLGTLLKDAVKRHRPDEVLILELTQYEWSLLWMRLPVVLSAIVFVQPPFIPSKLKRGFKYLKTRLLLRRNDWRTLFFLNGESSVEVLRKKIDRGTRFCALPDPVVSWEPILTPNAKMNAKRSTALYFGAISKRKGFDVLVDAVMSMSDTILDKMRLVICGKPEDPNYFQEQLNRLRCKEPILDLQVEARFVEEAEVQAFFVNCDWVLMPYTRPEYSSGILGLAAHACRPVLGPEEGLLGDLIQRHELGATCRMTAESLAQMLEHAVEKGIPFNSLKAATYVSERSPEKFATILLEKYSE